MSNSSSQDGVQNKERSEETEQFSEPQKKRTLSCSSSSETDRKRSKKSKKNKKRKRLSSNSSPDRERRRKSKKSKKKKKKSSNEKEKGKTSKNKEKTELDGEENPVNCDIPLDLMTPSSSKSTRPETKEEYEQRQSKIERRIDPVTGRSRLIKGDGEVLEECVSRERHIAINKAATIQDGEFFQSKVNKNAI